MDQADVLSIATDVAYALRQLRKFRDVERAIDALERVAEILSGELADDLEVSAAPELLAACRKMLVVTGGSRHWKGETHEALLQIEAAVALTEGVSP